MSNKKRSKCCNAPMVNNGIQCEACGSNGKQQEIIGYIGIIVSDVAFEKAEKHVRDWNKNREGNVPEAHEVVIAFNGQRREMTLREFLETFEFEGLPCLTCEGTGEQEVMETVYPGEPHQAPTGTAPCIDCEGTGVEQN